MKASEILRANADMFDERNKLYGEIYHTAGDVIELLFPNGINLNSPLKFARFAIIMHLVNKLMRICAQFEIGGHKDSNIDISVYASMLEELENP